MSSLFVEVPRHTKVISQAIGFEPILPVGQPIENIIDAMAHYAIANHIPIAWAPRDPEMVIQPKLPSNRAVELVMKLFLFYKREDRNSLWIKVDKVWPDDRWTSDVIMHGRILLGQV